jgi:hypothetical protein
LAGDSTPAAGVLRWSVIEAPLIWLAAFILISMPLHFWVSTRRR